MYSKYFKESIGGLKEQLIGAHLPKKGRLLTRWDMGEGTTGQPYVKILGQSLYENI